MKYLLLITVFVSVSSFAQESNTKMIIVGDVQDAATKEPLAYATVGVKGRTDETISDSEGKFRLSVPVSYHKDTLVVTYVGYNRFEKAISQLASVEHVILNEYTTLLEEVRIVYRQMDLREIDRTSRIIRGNLYAMDGEVTNAEFNNFLAWLDDYNKADLRKKYEFDLTSYNKSVRDFYTKYHRPTGDTKRRRDRRDTILNYNFCPAVNISYEAAVEYCKWLTDRYNENPKKKKFNKVVFRLPTLNEWQIAALGYDKFQSWNLLENTVEVIVAKDSLSMETMKGEKKKMKVDNTIQYPWYWVYYYRNTAFNSFNCYLGNFRIENGKICPAKVPAFDGFTMMAPVRCYFPNNIGLYDVAGNVAEMISEKGKACGGSWNDVPEQSTIQSVKNFSGPDETVGFRVFMEVIEP
ncbi:MAG TPA: SUMF1/EgtB/PvdO family nonheme iron enzyme [Cyclobacteriaceae bacterium]|nr:SUMF1/EgtB/PvdO family nonheme iron enzyme [Cyclobacteriaceae bacterium]